VNDCVFPVAREKSPAIPTPLAGMVIEVGPTEVTLLADTLFPAEGVGVDVVSL